MERFKYLSIVEWTRQAITERGLAAGDRFLSETELCRAHQVSRQTVRQALAVLEKEGLLYRRRGSGTFVRGPGAAGTAPARTVGVISTYFSDYIFPHIVSGVERVLAKNDLAMQLAVTNNMVAEEARALKAMLEQNVSGLIVEPSKSALPNPNTALYQEVRRREIPLVFFNAAYPWSDFPCVAMDDVAAGRLAAEHLKELGHERISGIFLLDDIQGHKRYQGFLEGQGGAEGGAESRVLWFSHRDKATLFTISAERVAALIAGSTAVVCYNDTIALGLFEFCRERGLNVPGELSIVGIDDSRLATICAVPLTSVRHPHQQLGELAAETLVSALGAASPAMAGRLFEPALVRRSSAASPKPDSVGRQGGGLPPLRPVNHIRP
jgi:GntR family transcriptional regulator of arabinose operon